MARRSAVGLVGGMALVVTLLVACGSGGPQPEASSAGPWTVEHRSETFVDPGRTTPAAGDVQAAPSRILETSLYIPRRSGAGSTAGRPLVVFVHGSGGNPEFYAVLLDAWAGRGYVVAAPRFPPAIADQSADVSFVIDEMLRLSTQASGPYGGLIDGASIGVAGHSAGGASVLGTGFNACCTDARVRAGVVMAGVAAPTSGGTSFDGVPKPLLVVHGEADPTVPYAEGRAIFERAKAPKVMLTVPESDVPSADHARPYVGSDNRALPDTRLVIDTTLAFLDRYLLDDRGAIERIRATIDAEPSYRLEVVEG